MKSLYETIFDTTATPEDFLIIDSLKDVKYKIKNGTLILTSFEKASSYSPWNGVRSEKCYGFYNKKLFDTLRENGIMTIVNTTDVAIEINSGAPLDDFKIISERGDVVIAGLRTDVLDLIIEAPVIMIRSASDRHSLIHCTFKAELLILNKWSREHLPKISANCTLDVPELRCMLVCTRIGCPATKVIAVDDGFKLFNFYKDIPVSIRLLKNIEKVECCGDVVRPSGSQWWSATVSKKKLGDDYVKLCNDDLPWSWVKTWIP